MRSALSSKTHIWVAFVLSTAALSCEGENAGSYAKRVESPNELIGGPSALGAVGDWVLGNGKIRIIVQDQGWSRGFGVFGGGIIDADLIRSGAGGNGAGGDGLDNFGEYFPALFLRAFDVGDQQLFNPETGEIESIAGVEVIADGSDGGPAILRTRASGGDFFQLVEQVVDLVVPPIGLTFETDYIIHPNARHVEVVGRLINRTAVGLDLSASGLDGLLEAFGGGGEVQVPIGDVLLFGAGNEVFSPAAVTQTTEKGGGQRPVCFELSFSVESAYRIQAQNGVSLPALPGLVTDFLATRGPRVSYGFAAGESERNYVWLNREQYKRDANATVSKSSMLVPFLISSFAGAYFEVPPDRLAPFGQEGDTFEYKRYLIIGDGDVNSIREELFSIKGEGSGVFEGDVVDGLDGRRASGIDIHILDEQRRPYSQATTDDDGRFRASLAPGVYYHRIQGEGLGVYPSTQEEIEATRFEIKVGDGVFRQIELPKPATVVVSVRDDIGDAIPAKITVLSQYNPQFDGLFPREFLFEKSYGEARRPTDLSWTHDEENKKREYVETKFFAPDGQGSARVRPTVCADEGGSEVCERIYDIVVSRGLEYEAFRVEGVRLAPGQVYSLEAMLERVVDTENYVSADLHIHTRNSVDSYTSIEDQVRHAAVEGLEVMVSTDHNFVSDFRPKIAELGLERFVSSVVGVELTTLEMGHFNAFPIDYDLAPSSHFPFVDVCYEPLASKTNRSAFDWVLCRPDQLFSQLRTLGTYGADKTIVQVNHPRDSVLGYFTQYYVDPYTMEAVEPSVLNHPEVDIVAGVVGVRPENDDTKQFAPESFSFDFDAIEVFNGKRLDLLHHFRLGSEVPEAVVLEKQDFVCGDGHPENARGSILLQKGGEPSFPGAVDDWMALLNRLPKDEVPVATGNSDTHSLEAEIGYPRTYVYVPPKETADGQPVRRDELVASLTPLDLVDGIQSKRIFTTNGPFLDVAVRTVAADVINPPCSSFVDESECVEAGCQFNLSNTCQAPARLWRMGEMVEYSRDASGTGVEFQFTLGRPSWVKVDRLVVWANKEIIAEIPVPETDENNIIIPWIYAQGFGEDTVVVVEAYGSESLFPIVTGDEEPPTNIGEALGGLSSGLGVDIGAFATTGDGQFAPTFIQTATPYALSNPIWLNIDGEEGFNLPGNDPGPGPAPDVVCPTTSQRSPRQVGEDLHRAPARFPKGDIRGLLPLLHKH